MIITNLKHVLVELLLELLVGIVNAKLLKAVDLEGLETINVQDADEVLWLGLGLDRIVNAINEPT